MTDEADGERLAAPTRRAPLLLRAMPGCATDRPII